MRFWHGLLMILLGVGLGLLLAAGVFYRSYQAFLETPLDLPAGGLEYEVVKGATARSVGHDWLSQGLTDSKWNFRLLLKLRPELARIHAGKYHLEPGLRSVDALEKLVRGDVIHYPVTLIPGWNFLQFRAVLADTPNLKRVTTEMTDEQIMDRLGRPGLHPEGRFFPDTYRFIDGDTDLDILERAFEKMERQLAAAWQTRAPDLPYKRPIEALTMASIVEKETGLARERAEIAGVFVRRLEKGMRLQTDPTVIYGLGADFDGNLRRRDLRADTAYNTYTRFGLPPTPIAMPGREAIDAALHPREGTSLYFVSRGDGSHQFSDTLADHNRAVRKYQLKRKTSKQ